jgi:hypothetical protein
MANIDTIQEEQAQDEVPTAIEIDQKNGDPYLAPESTPEKPVPCTISVLGSDAKRVKLAKDKADRILLRAGRKKLKPSDLRKNRIAIAAAAVTGWTGWTYGPDNAPFPCTPENIRAMLSKEHILDQVESGVNDHAEHADFFTSASSS